MTAAAKILGRMRNNPTGWRIEDLKPVYVKKFLELIDEVAHEKD